ncbi:MAG TPA: translation initiation factor IF-3 [Candidatus Omnitrophota bacterium]|nr:translation initiation factor IF-3 [Candidatus Omnitrophota bacterium]
MAINKYVRINEYIRVPEVRVIGANSEQLGVMIVRRAVDMAKEQGLDLVEVAPMAKPPVCRIIDFSKYKYEQEKKERKSKKSQHVTHLKEIRVKPHIDEHDYQVKLKQSIAFLTKHDKVKINLFFRGREMAFKEQGRQVLSRFVADLSEHGLLEKDFGLEGRVMSLVVAPKTAKK